MHRPTANWVNAPAVASLELHPKSESFGPTTLHPDITSFSGRETLRLALKMRAPERIDACPAMNAQGMRSALSFFCDTKVTKATLHC
jgi:hypothetical protein